jgi:succinate-semialdehyde dehydrogenase / glutarate-semialdehyde dehydrogenase
MELGGNAPVLVFEDADIETAVEGSMVAKMRNIGEACTAANRFYVHESMADAFAERLTARMAALKMGDGLEEGVDVGPLVNAETRDKVAALVDDAVARGAELRLGGAIPNRRGFFYPPTVLIRVPADAAGGNFWARRGPSDVSRSGGSGRARERHEIRPR